MLEKPDLQDEAIVACLQEEYGLQVAQIAFLPLGADMNAAVYRIAARDDAPYFVKLKRGDFEEIGVTLPKFLSDRGLRQIIAPIATLKGQLWARVAGFRLILDPFVEGRNGYEVELSDRHWVEFGAAVKSIHTTVLPPTLRSSIPRETYSPDWRERVRAVLGRGDLDASADPVAAKLAVFLKARRDEILALVERADRLAEELQARSPEFVLCHSDLHAGNILIDANDALYIVDWDSPVLAAKERDLMFAGAGLGFSGHTAREEEALFHRGYGQGQIDRVALAYYRYERIIQDIAVFCEQLLSTHAGGEDREQSFRYLISNIAPNGTIEMARKTETTGAQA